MPSWLPYYCLDSYFIVAVLWPLCFSSSDDCIAYKIRFELVLLLGLRGTIFNYCILGQLNKIIKLKCESIE